MSHASLVVPVVVVIGGGEVVPLAGDAEAALAEEVEEAGAAVEEVAYGGVAVEAAFALAARERAGARLLALGAVVGLARRGVGGVEVEEAGVEGLDEAEEVREPERAASLCY